MVTNQLELRVCGIQRSGNHAIISWILEQFKGKPVCFLNNVKHGDHDPYVVAPQRRAYGMDDVPQEEWRETPKALLVFSYEDDAKRLKPGATSLLESAFSPEFEAKRERYLGSSAKRLDVIILRDPANNFASRLKKLDKLTGVKDLPTIVRFWKELARAALAVEERRDRNTLIVRYNSWFSDKRYRQELSARLGGTFSDASLRQVSAIGGGSSFDKTERSADLAPTDVFRYWRKLLKPATYTRIPSYVRRLRGARDMKVMERWREFDDDERLRAMLDDAELMELAQRLFGAAAPKPANLAMTSQLRSAPSLADSKSAAGSPTGH
jgi:hypothetical protein